MHIKETHQFQGILRAVFTVSLRDIIHELLLKPKRNMPHDKTALKYYCAITFTAAFALTAYGADVTEEDVRTLFEKAAPHPRLLLNNESIPLLQQRIDTHENVKTLFNIIRKDADSLLNEPPQTYTKTGRRLLSVSREVLGRV